MAMDSCDGSVRWTFVPLTRRPFRCRRCLVLVSPLRQSRVMIKDATKFFQMREEDIREESDCCDGQSAKGFGDVLHPSSLVVGAKGLVEVKKSRARGSVN